MTVRAEIEADVIGWRVFVFEPQDSLFYVVRPNRPWVFWRPTRGWATRLARRKVRARERQRRRLAKETVHVP